ncbi:MAG: LamG domain-containing protein [Planctomycetes bacterium]|nr:LamG domain-containing protein [Planctomycetota bacterium]
MSKKLSCLIYFVLVLCLVGTSAAQNIDPSLVGCWKFDEGSGTIAYDSSGNGNDGTLVLAGSAISSAWVSGKYHSALSFDGVDDYVNLTNQPPITNGFTFSAWVKRNGDSPSCQIIFNNHQFFLRTMPENENSNNPFEAFVNLSDGSVEPRSQSNVASTIGQWFFVTVTWDKTTLKIYVNGELNGSSTRSGELTSTTVEARIGRGEQTNVNANPFNGLIDEVALFDVVLEAEDIEAIMNGGLAGVIGDQPLATRPGPKDDSLILATWVNLSWSPGDFAVSHDIYIGDNFDDVDAGAESTFVGNQADTFVVAGFPGFAYPDGLVPGTTYYWRVDEVNDTEADSPWKGDIWSFSIAPNTAYDPGPADGADSVNVDGSLSWTAGLGAILHTVYFGDNFDDVSNAAGGSPQGTTKFTPGTLKRARTYYWRVDEFDVVETHKGDIWSFTTEGAVTALDPANGAVDVTQTPVLTWTPGPGTSHEVYFGTDEASLELKGSGNLGSESFEPGQLEWSTTYYWRVDEVNSANADSPWTGPLWSFTTANFLIIDDMESYNDLDEGEPGSNRIYLAWADGFDNPATNGSVVGNANAPFAEQTIVNGGLQSMPMSYDNAVGKSEATLTLTSNRNWTENGVNTLTIWYIGDAANAPETMYVVLNGSAGVDNDNPNAAQVTAWTEWNIDLQAFADQGVNLANVTSITIGLGNRANPTAGGSGMMYFDDIRLYAP